MTVVFGTLSPSPEHMVKKRGRKTAKKPLRRKVRRSSGRGASSKSKASKVRKLIKLAKLRQSQRKGKKKRRR